MQFLQLFHLFAAQNSIIYLCCAAAHEIPLYSSQPYYNQHMFTLNTAQDTANTTDHPLETWDTF